jgi:Holliday junction resolvase-like predicted endonuclease
MPSTSSWATRATVRTSRHRDNSSDGQVRFGDYARTQMSTTDLGESLVGAYMRHIEQCSIVLYNSYFADQQGEVDVVAVKPGAPGEQRLVYLCEVTTHIGGMSAATVKRVPAKLRRLREFAELTFPDEEHRFQWWSPRVREGAVTRQFEQLVADWKDAGRSLEFVINDAYTRRIRALVQDAGNNTSTTNEPAYRMLQILTHLRGDKPSL